MVMDVTSLIDESRFNRFHARVVGICAVLVFLDGFDLFGIGYVAPDIMKALNLTKPMFGTVFSSALFGLTLGALGFGLIGDRWGRKSAFMACALIFGAASIATALQDSYQGLLIWRFIAGLGLGGATPIAVTLASEYSPRRLRASLIIIMYTNVSLGGLLAGYISSFTHDWGWQPIFWIGGFLPLLALPVLAVFLPESIDFLLLKRADPTRIARLLKGLDPKAALPPDAEFVSSRQIAARFPLRAIFAGRLALTTSIIWFTFFVALITLYFYATWLPSLLLGAGLTARQVVTIGAVGQVGTLAGSLLFARLVTHVAPFVMLCVGYICAAGVLILFTRIGGSLGLWIVAGLLAGAFIPGTQNAINAITALVYPPNIRSTGIGWAIGIGRIGAILGPSLAGLLLGAGWSSAELFAAAATGPLLAAVCCFWISRRLAGQEKPGPVAELIPAGAGGADATC